MNAPERRPPPSEAGGRAVPSPILRFRMLLADAALVTLFVYAAGYLGLGLVFTPRAAGILSIVLWVGPALAWAGLRLARQPRPAWAVLTLGGALAIGAYALLRPHVAGLGLVSLRTFVDLSGGLLLLRLGLQTSGVWGAAIIAWLTTGERTGRWSFARLGTDLLLTAIAALLVGGYALEKNFSLTELMLLAGYAVAGHALTLAYCDRIAGGSPVRRAAKMAGGAALSCGLWALAASPDGSRLYPGDAAIIFAGVLPLQLAWHAWYHRRAAGGASLLAPLQWAVVIIVVLLLHGPLLGNGTIGAGDAYWYRIMTADFVTQWRAGVFPVFAGQSEFAFNGAVSPVRLAPGLQHLAGLLDLVTLRQMTFPGLLNLVLLISYLGGALTCHGCLRAIEPRTPWLAVALSLLFATCPGLLALAYAGDLFMSVTTLPFVPLAFYGAWRTLDRRDLTGLLILVGALGAMWYCHPPIAFWSTVIATVMQLARLPAELRVSGTWRHWGIGALSFGLLTLCCFVSVGTLGLPGNPAFPPAMVETIRDAFAASLKPVSTNMASLGNFQLGWSLWAALGAGLVGLAWVKTRRPLAALLVATGVVLVFALPVPWLNQKLWLNMPQAVCDLTYMWPMQRFYVLLAALAAFAGYLALAPLLARWPRLGFAFLPLLLTALGWSLAQGAAFPRHVAKAAGSPREAQLQLLPQNLSLTRYAFSPFPTFPAYFSHGYTDPRMELRLLFADAVREFDSNRIALQDQSLEVVASGALTSNRANLESPILDLLPRLVLQPGRHYALRLNFEHPEFAGAFKLNGSRLSRLYWLPDSGYGTALSGPSRSFGARADLSHVLTLWTDGDVPEEVRLQFVFSGEVSREASVFARFELVTFDPARLPIRVESWAPFRARVRSNGDTWLETPRMFLPGYKATVNGKPMKASRSPEGLVKLPVPAGESVVELNYVGTWPLRLAYFTSLAAWLALLVLAVRAWLGPRDVQRANS